MERFTQIIESTKVNQKPTIQFIKQASVNQAPQNFPTPSKRLGIFASSFNPITTAHIELIRQAKEKFSLDETLALAGMANADKSLYDCSLEERLMMLELALNNDAQISIGLSSHAFFVDMLDALDNHYASQTELHFILGFDTFERVLDREDKYTKLYQRNFADRNEALEYLLVRSCLVVAGRKGANHKDVAALAAQLPATLSERVLYLDFPDNLAEQSATEVRQRLRQGLSIKALVPAVVEQYINEQSLYA
jgi:nicotinate (nicotinamide) nucleotide adenylyltransferase